MFNVEASSAVNNILMFYADKFYNNSGEDCVLNLLDSYDEAIDSLTYNVNRGCKLEDIPGKYRAITFWSHLWLIYLVEENKVYVDLIIDDRQSYGKLFKY